VYTWCWRWRSVFFSLPRLRSSRSSVFSSKLLCLFVILLLVFPSVSCSFFSLASSSGFLKCSVYSSRWSRFVMSAFCFSLLCVRPPPFLFFCLLLCFPFSLCFFSFSVAFPFCFLPSSSRLLSVFFSCSLVQLEAKLLLGDEEDGEADRSKLSLLQFFLYSSLSLFFAFCVFLNLFPSLCFPYAFSISPPRVSPVFFFCCLLPFSSPLHWLRGGAAALVGSQWWLRRCRRRWQCGRAVPPTLLPLILLLPLFFFFAVPFLLLLFFLLTVTSPLSFLPLFSFFLLSFSLPFAWSLLWLL